MNLVGIQESFNDYPDEISIIVFTKYCTWNCKNCHNKFNLLESDILSYDYIFDYLEESKDLIKHIVISGGECTQEEDILFFVKKLKEKGFKIKVDTNGTYPETLFQLLPYLSVVAMDIKEDFTNFERYKRICRNITEKEFKNVIKSIKLLSDWNKSDKDNHKVIFRTTMLDELIDTSRIKENLKDYSYSDYIIQKDLTKIK